MHDMTTEMTRMVTPPQRRAIFRSPHPSLQLPHTLLLFPFTLYPFAHLSFMFQIHSVPFKRLCILRMDGHFRITVSPVGSKPATLEPRFHGH